MNRVWLIVASIACGSGCIDPSAFSCVDSTQCVLEPGGVCEGNGLCSYPDSDCDSGQRWSRNAGSLAFDCVPSADSAEGSGSSTSPGPTTATNAETTEGSSAESDAGSGIPATCGDGNLDDGEECDDGDQQDGDGCNADCRPSLRALWWATPAAHDFDNLLHALAITEEGDIVAAGYASTEQAADEFDSDQYDFLFTRHSGSGDELDVSTEAHGGRDELRCTFVDTVGDVWVGGERFTDTGAELWLGRVGGGGFTEELGFGELEPRETVAHDCKLTADGKVVAVGMLDGEQAGGYEGWDRLIVYDPFGDGWTQHNPSAIPLRDVVQSVEPLPDGRLLVAGSISITLEDVSDRWVALLDSDGNELWPFVDAGPGGGQEEVLDAIVIGSRVFAAGATLVNQGNTEREWLAVLDTRSGALQQEDDLSLPGPAVATAIAADPNGDVMICGTVGSNPDEQAFVARFDPTARERLWLRDDLDLARARDITVDTDGTVVVVGSSVSRGENGPAVVARLAP